MPILPKKHFTWREPRQSLEILDEQQRILSRWWHRPLAAAFITVSFLSIWVVARLNPAKHPPPFLHALMLTVGASLVAVYFLPWLFRKFPSQVGVFDRHIACNRGYNAVYAYAKLKSFSWIPAPDFSILTLTYPRGRQVFIGVPPDISRDTLSQFLRERGLTEDPGAPPPAPNPG